MKYGAEAAIQRVRQSSIKKALRAKMDVAMAHTTPATLAARTRKLGPINSTMRINELIAGDA